jgi:hypothetical protein
MRQRPASAGREEVQCSIPDAPGHLHRYRGTQANSPIGSVAWDRFIQEICDELFAEESPPSEAYDELEKRLADGTVKIKFDSEGCIILEEITAADAPSR